jgi:hypothetical protein
MNVRSEPHLGHLRSVLKTIEGLATSTIAIANLAAALKICFSQNSVSSVLSPYVISLNEPKCVKLNKWILLLRLIPRDEDRRKLAQALAEDELEVI